MEVDVAFADPSAGGGSPPRKVGGGGTEHFEGTNDDIEVFDKSNASTPCPPENECGPPCNTPGASREAESGGVPCNGLSPALPAEATAASKKKKNSKKRAPVDENAENEKKEKHVKGHHHGKSSNPSTAAELANRTDELATLLRGSNLDGAKKWLKEATNIVKSAQDELEGRAKEALLKANLPITDDTIEMMKKLLTASAATPGAAQASSPTCVAESPAAPQRAGEATAAFASGSLAPPSATPMKGVGTTFDGCPSPPAAVVAPPVAAKVEKKAPAPKPPKKVVPPPPSVRSLDSFGFKRFAQEAPPPATGFGSGAGGAAGVAGPSGDDRPPLFPSFAVNDRILSGPAIHPRAPNPPTLPVPSIKSDAASSAAAEALPLLDRDPHSPAAIGLPRPGKEEDSVCCMTAEEFRTSQRPSSAASLPPTGAASQLDSVPLGLAGLAAALKTDLSVPSLIGSAMVARGHAGYSTIRDNELFNAEVLMLSWSHTAMEQSETRPAFFGTWNGGLTPARLREMGRVVRDQEMRRLTAEDMKAAGRTVDYDYDSGDEWEPNDDGDDVNAKHSSDDDDDEEDEDEDDAGSFIDDNDLECGGSTDEEDNRLHAEGLTRMKREGGLLEPLRAKIQGPYAGTSQPGKPLDVLRRLLPVTPATFAALVRDLAAAAAPAHHHGSKKARNAAEHGISATIEKEGATDAAGVVAMAADASQAAAGKTVKRERKRPRDAPLAGSPVPLQSLIREAPRGLLVVDAAAAAADAATAASTGAGGTANVDGTATSLTCETAPAVSPAAEIFMSPAAPVEPVADDTPAAAARLRSQKKRLPWTLEHQQQLMALVACDNRLTTPELIERMVLLFGAERVSKYQIEHAVARTYIRMRNPNGKGHAWQLRPPGSVAPVPNSSSSTSRKVAPLGPTDPPGSSEERGLLGSTAHNNPVGSSEALLRDVDADAAIALVSRFDVVAAADSCVSEPTEPPLALADDVDGSARKRPRDDTAEAGEESNKRVGENPAHKREA